MDPGLVIVLFVFGPLLMLAFVARTRFSWLPGILVIAAAVVLFGMIDDDLHGDVGGIGAFANGVLTLAASGLSIYGVILLCVGASMYRKAERRQPSTLPVATAVAGVNKPD